MTKEHYIGLMSGTSIDAIDAALVEFDKEKLILIATHSIPIDYDLKQAILALCYPGHNAINRMGAVDVKLGRLFARSCLELLEKTGFSTHDITAIGSHGQTIRHMPNQEFPFTLQIGDPNIIAAETGITTIADFRRRDMALGGQAAPLAPAFHVHLLRDKRMNQCIVNIGGIANLTFLPEESTQPVIGFDTGPGNTLMDAWCAKHLKKSYDENGIWAESGEICRVLLNSLLADAYFSQLPPKSTGREYFNLDWLEQHLFRLREKIPPQDIQATLLRLTAKSIINAIDASCPNSQAIWVCGGGAKNNFLMKQLQTLNNNLQVNTTEALGIHPDWVEAAAFAWLARQTLHGKPGNLPSVTGARSACVLGAIYPGIKR